MYHLRDILKPQSDILLDWQVESYNNMKMTVPDRFLEYST